MENSSMDYSTTILQLPNDCLCLIFQHLDCSCDRESFGLTCHRWLQIQNSCRRSLQFHCSLNLLNLSSLSQSTSPSMSAFHLFKLLNRFQQLQSLSLSGCIDLPDSGLTQLQYHGSKLQSLNLDCCFGITADGLALVASGCSSLTILSLYRCNVTDSGLETLAKSCLALEDLNLAYCSLVSDDGVRAISQNCRQLRAIRISYCKAVSGIGFQGCSQTLAYVEADSCKLEPDGIRCVLSGGGVEYLSVLNLSWNIRGDGLTAIGTGFASRLRVLNFRFCRTIGDATIVMIARGCPLLQEWNLSLCHEVRILGWRAVGSNCLNLKTLHVNRCRNLCDQGLRALRSGCKQLSTLYITRCARLSSTAIEIFKLSRGDVEIIEDEIACIAPKQAFRF
ncbi:PREDICTED: F-box/LRR-repeat protein 12 [Ipomoea nil]|uniref:F-box/LRR-repeat protein 12 n=1 Tax=Ipomoea nil TaxID=35883 RepID=UPI000901AAF3|nr:PREDICTED: F-box/LRR-repeat protein 12 [Ipomoea nil]